MSRKLMDDIAIGQWKREAEFNAAWSDAFLVTGLVSAGLVTYLLWSDHQEESRLQVVPDANGASVLYRSTF